MVICKLNCRRMLPKMGKIFQNAGLKLIFKRHLEVTVWLKAFYLVIMCNNPKNNKA